MITRCCTCFRHIVSLGVIGPLCDMLTAQAPKVVTVVLECLENILKVGKLYQDLCHGVNPYAFTIEEVNGNYNHVPSLDCIKLFSPLIMYCTAARVHMSFLCICASPVSVVYFCLCEFVRVCVCSLCMWVCL